MAQALQQKTATPVASPPAPAPSPVRAIVPARVQLQSALRVSSPTDPAEKEAESTARKVMRMAVPAVSSPVARGPFVSPYVSRFADAINLARSATTVARKADGQPNVGANVSSEISSSLASGSPLPLGVRRFMEPRFGADFSGVRIHTGDKAAGLNRQFNAQAFAVGNQIFFGRDKFQPETSAGKELIAHELTHTIQQGSVVQRSEAPEVTERTPPHVQRLGLGDALDYFADKANLIPGFRMFTIVLGVNPINMNPVERSAANIMRAIVEFIPGGGLITQALDNHGVFEKVGAWVEQQIRSLGLTGAAIKAAVTQFLNTLSWTDIFDLGGVWARAKRIFSEPIDRLISFAKQLIVGILKFIKDAILRPLAKLAEGTRGYDLLKALLGQDPVTGEPVPRNAETLIGGFMKLIGQEEVWQNVKKSNAIARAWAWFQGAMGAALGFVREIPGLFIKAFQSLELMDVVVVPRAFAKITGVFGSFIGRFVSWAGGAVWKLLEIIFEVVSPAALGYIKRTGAALMSILKNPLPFVGNLVKAAKQGFMNFADHIGAHLKSGLIDWLTGSLPGVYIPKAFELGEIVKFVFSVLGISWANVRQKLVKVVGEPVVKAMETGFDIVVTLVTQGPAAAWDKIKEQLTNLKDMVIGGITDFVVDTIVKKAIPKLIAMFIPGAGFISAIISIYDTIMVFVQKISKIIQVVTGFIDSIVAIASGAIGAAAKRVESVLASLLSLAISFLAGFLGLGGIADKIMGVINKVRVSVDKAIDALIAWIVKMAKSLFAKVFEKDKKDGETEESKAVREKVKTEVSGKTITDAAQASSLISAIYTKLSGQGLKGIRLVYDSAKPGVAGIKVSASIAKVVAEVPLTSVGGAAVLKEYVATFDFLAGGTTLYVYYDADNKRYSDSPIDNDPGGAHAEAKFASHHVSKLRAEITEERKKGKIKTAADKPIKVELNLNRIACPRCAPILGGLASNNKDMFFIVKASSVSNEATLRVHATWIAELIEAGVVVEPLGIWPQIQKKFLELAKKVGKGEIAFKKDSGNFQTFEAAARRIEENLSREQAVQDLINEAKMLLEQKKKGSKESLATVPPKGSGT